MTDLEKLLSIIEGKVDYERNDNNKHLIEFIPNGETLIILNNSNENLGYGGFQSQWFFDKDGNFLGVGHVE